MNNLEKLNFVLMMYFTMALIYDQTNGYIKSFNTNEIIIDELLMSIIEKVNKNQPVDFEDLVKLQPNYRNVLRQYLYNTLNAIMGDTSKQTPLGFIDYLNLFGITLITTSIIVKYQFGHSKFATDLICAYAGISIFNISSAINTQLNKFNKVANINEILITMKNL